MNLLQQLEFQRPRVSQAACASTQPSPAQPSNADIQMVGNCVTVELTNNDLLDPHAWMRVSIRKKDSESLTGLPQRHVAQS